MSDQINHALDGAIKNINTAKEIHKEDPQMAWLSLLGAASLIESVSRALDRRVGEAHE